MKKYVRLTKKQKVDIINAYSNELTSMIELAKKYSVTRQAIYKILKHAGVDTSKRKLPVSCTVCNTIVYRNKANIRKAKHIFCSRHCYQAWLHSLADDYKQNRHGQRIARSVVSQYFSLQSNHVVHHENKNNLDNRPENLRVFSCQGDHIRYHRGFDVEPVWDGRYI